MTFAGHKGCYGVSYGLAMICTHTHTHTHTHSLSHTHTQLYIHTYRYVDAHTHIHIHIQTQAGGPGSEERALISRTARMARTRKEAALGDSSGMLSEVSKRVSI